METVAKVISKNIASTTTQILGSACKTCGECGERIEAIINILGKERKVPVMCKCREEEYNKQREVDRQKEKQRRLERLKEYSLMDKKFENCTFKNWKIDQENQKWYEFGKKYCSSWQKMKENNVGMLLWGVPGTGKTYLTSCIANELLSNFTPVIAISSIGLLNRIKETYKTYGQDGEVEIINSLKNASLLILDDLGAENGTEWAKSKLYEIIDSRYRDGKPLIVTTNLTPQQLREKMTSADGVTRTYDRVVEMCPPLEVKGNSKRVRYAVDKTQMLKELLD